MSNFQPITGACDLFRRLVSQIIQLRFTEYLYLGHPKMQHFRYNNTLILFSNYMGNFKPPIRVQIPVI